jgi:hypothetical protein
VQDGRINSILALHRGIVSSHPVTTPSFMNPDAVGKPLIFVSDGVSNVDIFLKGGRNKMVGQITGLNGAYGLATDTGGHLYVATNDPDVRVYAPPYTQAPTLLNVPGYDPNDIAISTLGVIGTANFCNAPSCANGTGSVTFFAKNSPTPCATFADPTNFAEVFYDAFDDKGNLYITGLNAANSVVVGKVKGGCAAKKITLLTTTNDLGKGYAGGIQVDKADRIAILAIDETDNSVIDTYNPPKKGSLGSPVSTTPLTSPDVAVTFAFLASGHDFYTAEEGSSGRSSEYDYPVGGAAENTIAVGLSPSGVAVTPPLVP